MQLRIIEHSSDRLRQCPRIAGLDQDAASRLEQLRQATHSSGYHRYSVRHRGEGGAAQTFARGAHHEEVGLRQYPVGIRQGTQQLNPIIHSELSYLTL
jgi:hypothetical protein